MGVVGVSTTAASAAPRSSIRPSSWLACPLLCRSSLQGADGPRRLIVVSERQKFYATRTSDQRQHGAPSYGAFRPLRVSGNVFPPVFMENKRHAIHSGGYLSNYQEHAFKTALSDSASSWVIEGRTFYKDRKDHQKRMLEQIHQQIGDNSLLVGDNDMICSSITLEEVSGVVTEPDTISLQEGGHTIRNLIGSSTISQDTLRTNGNIMTAPEFASSQLKNSLKKAKAPTMVTQEETIKHFEEKSKVNGTVFETGIEKLLPTVGTSIEQKYSQEIFSPEKLKHIGDLTRIYKKVLVVNTVSIARKAVQKLITKYKKLVHACDTEVAKIDVKQETPVDHGKIICFSIYSGPTADFGDGKSCLWVDVLDGDQNILQEFAPFFEDHSIKKVWHNYSFDFHIIQNSGIKVSGFHADTIHLARLWDSSRRMDGGYSLEALTSDKRVMSRGQCAGKSGWNDDDELLIGKISMEDIFGKKKLRKDGSEGKVITVAPVEELQREERIPWICYSARDAISTLNLYESLKEKLMKMPWHLEGRKKGTMLDFYEEYWQPFGTVLVEMEAAGMLVDRRYLSEIERVATSEQQIAAEKFRKWASKYCSDAKYMNVGSDTQIRQILFGGISNTKDPFEMLPVSRTFKVLNVDNVIEDGKKSASKYMNIRLHKIGEAMHAEMFTPSGWPSVSADALKMFAGKVSADHIYSPEDSSSPIPEDIDDTHELHGYGSAYEAFGKGREGLDACHAIAALCAICSIDSLISNFIRPLQGDCISGKEGRIHCSLNINTETGRLSARRPNLQNPPALEKDRYKIRQAFIAAPGNSLIVADYGQLELRILAHLAGCKSMLDAFKAGGDFHSRTAINMYPYIREAVENGEVLLEWHPQAGEEKPPVPLLKDAFASERRKAKMLNFSIAYGKTPVGLSRDWKVSVKDARETVRLWYNGRQEVLEWQEARKREVVETQCVHTLLGRARKFPSVFNASKSQRGHIERAAINTPVQGSAADVAMCAMLEITRNQRLRELKWKLLLQVHDEVILEGPSESSAEAKAIVVECMSKPFYGRNILKVDLAVDAKCAQNWYAAK